MLVSPDDVALEWTADASGAAGRVVEFATEPDGPYTILRFVPPDQTSYAHRDLMPATTFYYRVRSFYGPASGLVQITLPPGPLDETADANGHEWAVPRRVPAGVGAERPVGTAAAAPTDLRATVMHANGIRFTWTEHAADEEGYLLEVRPAGRPDFSVAAVLDPDVNSFGLMTLPTEKRASYRVRAYYFGVPSNIAHQTTGPDG